MIITQSTPFTSEQITQLREQFDTYIKTVIDIENKVCSAGMDRHYEGEQILLGQGSKQTDIWGGGLDVNSHVIDFNSFINIRPHDNNPSNDILSLDIRNKYEQLTRFFFPPLYE